MTCVITNDFTIESDPVDLDVYTPFEEKFLELLETSSWKSNELELKKIEEITVSDSCVEIKDAIETLSQENKTNLLLRLSSDERSWESGMNPAFLAIRMLVDSGADMSSNVGLLFRGIEWCGDCLGEIYDFMIKCGFDLKKIKSEDKLRIVESLESVGYKEFDIPKDVTSKILKDIKESLTPEDLEFERLEILDSIEKEFAELGRLKAEIASKLGNIVCLRVRLDKERDLNLSEKIQSEMSSYDRYINSL
jgi:hypothetical protein